LKRYGLREITGDRFGSQWVKERFQQHGLLIVRNHVPQVGM
jgi:hypothetical protein